MNELPPPDHVSDLLLNLKNRHDRGVYFFPLRGDREFLSYAGLYHQAKFYLGALQAHGVKPGNKVVFQLRDEHHFLILYWACILGGQIPVPVALGSGESHRNKLARIAAQLDRPYFVTHGEEIEALHQFFVERLAKGAVPLRRLLAVEELASIQINGRYQRSNPADTAFIQYSSGSTGDPKGVVLTHRNILCNLAAMLAGSKLGTGDKTLSWMPLTHDMGLIGFHLTPLAVGVDHGIMSPGRFLLNPMSWLMKASAHRVTVLGSPNFGYRHFLDAFHKEANRKKARDWDLSHVRLIFNGAEPISAPLSRRFCQALAPLGLKESAMFPVYGMAEATLAVTFPPAGEPILTRRPAGKVTGDTAFVDLGHAVQGCAVRVLDDSDTPVPQGIVGHIQIRGDNVSPGYYRRDGLNRDQFTPDGWLRTGDLGFFHGDRLVVTGREKDVLFRRGQNYYAHDLEEIAANLDQIQPGEVAFCGVPQADRREQIVAFVRFRGEMADFAVLSAQLRHHMGRHMGLEPDQVAPIRRLPRTTSGKLMRFKLVEDYLAGAFDAVLATLRPLIHEVEQSRSITLPQTALEYALADLWKEVLGRVKVGRHEHFLELGGDSVKACGLAVRIRSRFKVRFPLEEIFLHPTLMQMAGYLETAPAADYHEIESTQPRAVFPASAEQERILFLDRMENHGVGYHIYEVVETPLALDLPLLQRALNQLVSHHEILRSQFQFLDGGACVTVLPELETTIAETAVDESDWQVRFHETSEPFDLACAPLFRITLARTEQGKTLLFFDFHHIICDGSSLGILIEELFVIYKGSDLNPPDLQYRDYALWQQAYLSTHHILEKERFWKDLLANPSQKITLPTDPGRRGGEWTADRVVIDMDEALTRDIRGLAASAETTLGMVVLTAFKCLLAKYSGMEDILLGTVTAGRNHHGLEDLPGMFVKTVVLRTTIDAESGFQDLLIRVRDHFFHVYENQDYPFDKVVAAVATNRSFGSNPLFDICFVMQNFTRPQIELDGFELSERPFHPVDTKFDLSLAVHELEEGLRCEFEFRSRLFARKRIERMADHYRRLLHHVAARHDITRAEIQILSQTEKQRVLTIFNNGSPQQPRFMTDLLTAHAADHPSAPCVFFEDQSWSYAQFAQRVDRLADALAARGVGSGDVVGLLLDPSDWMPALILALWKLRAAYLYLSPELPVLRRNRYIETAGAMLVLHQQTLEQCDRPQLHVETLVHDHPPRSAPGRGEPEDIAAVIFTSGSTGQPKAVLIRQKGIFHALCACSRHHTMQRRDCQLALSAYSFDPSLVQTFLPLLPGASVCIASRLERQDPRLTVALIKRRGISHLGMASSQLEHLCEARAHFNQPDRGVRFIMIGGEAFRPEAVFLAKKWFPNAMIGNYYGPTEATVAVTFDMLTQPLDPGIIGRPFDHVRIHIVGRDGQVQPVGYAGELCIAGESLAAGYRPDHFNEGRFVPDPFFEGQIMYRSGDSACWLPDGRIRFLGRMDHQEKIRGFRIEPGEIETVIASFSGVRKVLVAGVDSENDGRRLCAWFSAADKVDIPALQAFIAERTPGYMVPAWLIQLDQMPLTNHGKIDRSQLPQPVTCDLIRREIKPARNELEKLLADVWGEALGLDDVGIEDNFFDLGGHSLSANRLMTRIETRLELEAGVRLLFQYPTIAQLAPQLQTMLDQHKPAADESIKALGDRFGTPIEADHVLLDGRRRRIWRTDAPAHILRELCDTIANTDILPHYLLPADCDQQPLTFLSLDDEPNHAAFQAAVNHALAEFQEKLVPLGSVVRRYAAGHHPAWFVERNLRSVLLGEFYGQRGLDAARIYKCLAGFVERQGLLRSCLVEAGSEFVEFEAVSLPEPPIFDLSAVSPDHHRAMIETIAAGLRQHLLATPALDRILFSAALVKVNFAEYRILIGFDHIIADYDSPPVALEWLAELNRRPDQSVQLPAVTPFHEFAQKVVVAEDDPRIAEHARHENIRDFVNQVGPLHRKYGMGKAIVFSQPYHFEGAPHSGDDFLGFGLFMAAAVLGLHFDLDEAPLRVLTSRRRFAGLNFYQTIGDFHDSLPVVLSTTDTDPTHCGQQFRSLDDKYNRASLYMSNLGSIKELYHGIFKSPFNFNYVGLIRRRDVDEMLAKAKVFSFVSYPIYAYREGSRMGLIFFHGLERAHLEALNALAVRYFHAPFLRPIGTAPSTTPGDGSTEK